MSSFSQELVILTSPPASGKTYWISKLAESIPEEKILVISPLRALRDECKNSWGDKINVMTPEEWVGQQIYSRVLVFDEFHLYFYWGDSFRPMMWEVFYALAISSETCFLLTATLSKFMLEEIKFYTTQFDVIRWFDHGNHSLRLRPADYFLVPSKRWIMNEILNDSDKCTRLIFCKYRQEVFEVEKLLLNKGFVCLTCVGGESRYMAERLKTHPHPDFIISTTVLSHGVNLPDISKIYFLYVVENLDFWIQMTARGGRRGERYQVFALERPTDLNWSYLRNLIQVLWLGFKRKYSLSQLA